MRSEVVDALLAIEVQIARRFRERFGDALFRIHEHGYDPFAPR